MPRLRRSLLVALAGVAALGAAPSAASAATLPNAMTSSFRLAKGKHMVAWQVTTAGGALSIRLRVSNVLFPSHRLTVTVKPTGGQQTTVINTASTLNCQGAAGTTYCEVGLDAPAGVYTIRLHKLSTPKLKTTVTTAWS